MINGWLNIDKPLGVTSNKVLGHLKRILGNKPKMGHAGTLDPLASGILPIALGEATKTIPFLMEARKTYEFTIKFGSETDTEDAEGKITKTTDVFPDLEALRKILPEFTGKIRQTPPAYSAIKINGQRAYDLARKGEEFEIKEREVTIWELGIRHWELGNQKDQLLTPNSQPLREATLRAICSKGTYIRSLGRDIARALSSFGHIIYLRRVDYGMFTEADAVKLDLSLQMDRDYLISRVRSTDVVLDDIPVLQVDFETVKLLRNGLIIDTAYPQGIYRIYFEDKFQAIAESSGSKLKTQRVFNL